MKREEEIKQEMSKIAGTHPDWNKNDCMRMGFYEGAKWADRTMIDKACDWIQMNAMKYVNSIGGCMYFDVINSTKNFKKAMEL